MSAFASHVERLLDDAAKDVVVEEIEGERIYCRGLLTVPSVTTVMRMTGIDQFPDTIPPDVLARARRRGTLVHDIIERCVVLGGSPLEVWRDVYCDVEDPHTERLLEAAERWWQDHRESLFAGSEVSIVADLGFGATIDLVVVDEELRSVEVIDFKTGSWRSVHKIQMAAYMRALQDATAAAEPALVRSRVVELGARTYSQRAWLPGELESEWSVFRAALQVAAWTRRNS